MSVALNDPVAEQIHPRIYSLGLIVIWLRFMRACRAFRSLGPFICILGNSVYLEQEKLFKSTLCYLLFTFESSTIFFLFISGSVIEDTMKFAFLFFEFFIPYTVGFWIIFGGREDSSIDWKNFNDLVYSVWNVSERSCLFVC